MTHGHVIKVEQHQTSWPDVDNIIEIKNASLEIIQYRVNRVVEHSTLVLVYVEATLGQGYEP